MTTILKAKPVRDQNLAILKKRTNSLNEKGITPFMKVILVGTNDASLVYTKNKKKFCESFGAKCEIIDLEESINKSQLTDIINTISKDPLVHGLFIQLPLPAHLTNLDLENLIPPEKDIDGLSNYNIGHLLKGTNENSIIPCTPKGILTLLDFYNITLEGKNVAIIGRSNIVGKPMFLLATQKHATVTLCHSKTKDLLSITQNADIIILAMGKAKFLNKSYLNNNKNQVVIDVGINRNDEGKLCGDADYSQIVEFVEAITPVPGGVGPMTILSLAQNLLQAAENSLVSG